MSVTNSVQTERSTIQITSADDGTQVPSASGLDFGNKDVFFHISNGTTIDAVLQRRTQSGNWVTIPDADSRTTLDGAKEFIIMGGGIIRINVTTATGTWDVDMKKDGAR